MDTITKSLLGLGLICIISALIWHLSGGKIPLGRLPGDIRFQTENTKVFIPLTTSLLLSGLLSLIVYLFRKF